MHVKPVTKPYPLRADINDTLDAVAAILQIIERIEMMFEINLTGWIRGKFANG